MTFPILLLCLPSTDLPSEVSERRSDLIGCGHLMHGQVHVVAIYIRNT